MRFSQEFHEAHSKADEPDMLCGVFPMARSALSLLFAAAAVLPATLLVAQEQQQQQRQDRWQDRQLSPELSEFTSAYETLLGGRFQEALNQLAEFEKKFPASTFADRALFWKAFCHAKLENFGKALELNQELVEKFQKSKYADDALVRIGEINEKYLHRYPEAIQAYRQVIEKFPASANWGQAVNNEAQILERRVRDFSNAQDRYNENVQNLQSRNAAAPPGRSNEQNWFAWNGQARIDFIQAHSDYNFVPLTRYYVAAEDMEKADFARAESVLVELLKQYPDARIADLATLRLALCRQQLGKTNEAREGLEKLAVSPYESIREQAARRLEEMNAAAVTVEVDLYSGKPNPVRRLTAEEVREVERRLQALPTADSTATPPQLGYRGCVIRNWPAAEGKGEKVTLRVFGGTIVVQNRDGTQTSYQEIGRAHV
jgi:TolA-binding protein